MADSNGDGLLSPKEAHPGAFAQLDTNSDGALSPGELRSAPIGKRGKRQGMRRFFERFDGGDDS